MEYAEMTREVADVEAPDDGPFDLGPALPTHLVEVGVVPDVLDGAREAAVAVEEAGEWVIGPQRYVSNSALRVRCTPTSSPRYPPAASRAQGHGTISDALEARPSRTAS